jgi:hypothetical protein
MLGAGGQSRRLATNCRQKHENTHNTRNYGYKDQVFALHGWLSRLDAMGEAL